MPHELKISAPLLRLPFALALIVCGLLAQQPKELHLEAEADCRNPALHHERSALKARLAALTATIAAVPAPPNLAELNKEQQEKQTRLGEVTNALEKLPKDCRLGDVITVSFVDLHTWMKDTQNKPKDLALVLDGRVMKGLNARGPYDAEEELEFDLKRLDGDDNKENRDAWNALLGRTKDRTISLKVALGGNPPYFGTATFAFRVFPSYSLIIFLIVLLVIIVLLAGRSDILRDAPSAAGAAKLSYSLARSQMAWWFFIIVASYLYIWMITGDRDSLTSGALILIGISAATGLGAVVVDSSKRDERESLQNEQAALTTSLAALGPAIVAAQAATPTAPNLDELLTEQQQKQSRLAEVNTALKKLPSPPGPSQGFLLDILRDETGVSFHRFQMAVWTIVLGFVFIVAVYRSLAMPDFSATLLGLMGISAGTYVGFKIPDPPK